MLLHSHPISNVWFELYLTFSYEFNFQFPFHDLFELNGVSFSVQTPEVSHLCMRISNLDRVHELIYISSHSSPSLRKYK